MTQIHLQDANGNLAAAFPKIVRLCLKMTARTDYRRQLQILTLRRGLDGAPVSTLEELGAVHGVSRQRIEQIQSMAEERIRQLLDGTLKRRGWDICPSLRLARTALKQDLQAAGPGLTRTRFQSVVRQRFGNGVTGNWFELFASMMDFCLLQPTGSVKVADLRELWIPIDSVPRKSINEVFKALNALKKSPQGVSLTTLLADLRRAGHTDLDEPFLKAMISACPRVQFTRNGLVRVRTEWLGSAADQAWRVLQAHGKLIERCEITRQVNAPRVGKRGLDPMSVESVTTQLSGDARFTCCGKSGFWGLSEWGTVDDITIVQAMEKALHAAGTTLTLSELTGETIRLRPDASKKSIESYVNQRPDLFVRAGRGKVALASWRLDLPQVKPRNKVRCGTADFLAAVELIRDDREAMPLAELVDGVARLTEQAEGTVRLRLKTLDGVVLEDLPGVRGKQVRFTTSSLGAPSEAGPTQRERIQKTIRQVLDNSEIVFEQKKDLYEEVNRQLPCKRPTFYRYFSEMGNVRAGDAGRE